MTYSTQLYHKQEASLISSRICYLLEQQLVLREQEFSLQATTLKDHCTSKHRSGLQGRGQVQRLNTTTQGFP